MSGGGAEFETLTIKAMVGSACSGYPRDKSGACSSEGGKGDGADKPEGDGEED